MAMHAINSESYSGKQFEVYLASEDTYGTFGITGTNGNDAHRIDVEGITLPTFSPAQEFEMRTGASRIAEFDQIFSSTSRVTTEVTLSGRLTQPAWVMFMESVTGDQFDGGTGSDSVLTLDSSYAPANMKDATAAASVSDFSKAVSLYFKAPTADAHSYKLTGCICTNFSIDADMTSAAGRFNYTATFQTQHQPVMGAVTVTDAASIGSNNLFLNDLSYKNMGVMNYDGSTDEYLRPIFGTFNLAIDNPTTFLGAQGTNGEPEVVARATPELSITYGGTIKYDSETRTLVEAFKDSGQATAGSYVHLYMADVDAVADYETPTGAFFGASSSKKFGFQWGRSKLTTCEVSSDDVAMINLEAKVLSRGGTSNTAHFLGGDNAS